MGVIVAQIDKLDGLEVEIDFDDLDMDGEYSVYYDETETEFTEEEIKTAVMEFVEAVITLAIDSAKAPFDEIDAE